MRRAIGIMALMSLSACGGGIVPAARPSTIGASAPSKAPPIPLTGGMDRIVGRDARALTGVLGQPDLDVTEGLGRKMQFRSGICVLDAYLYPPAGGGVPTVTYVDTRQRDGAPIDRASCLAALTRRDGGK